MERREDLVNLLSKLHIPIGDPALGMSDERESDGAPTNINIGMVIDALGVLGHPTDCLDPVEVRGEGHRPTQRAVGALPSIQIRRGGIHFVIAQHSHT